MGWSLGYDTNWQRDIGYGVPAYCDQPGCGAEIYRGLAYVCGGEPYGGDAGCGLYFCSKHLSGSRASGRRGHVVVCTRCANYKMSYKPTPDHPKWIEFKATDESWAEWRKEQQER